MVRFLSGEGPRGPRWGAKGSCGTPGPLELAAPVATSQNRNRTVPKIHRVGPESGSTLSSYRDFRSNCWVNLRILGQPCELYVTARLVDTDGSGAISADEFAALLRQNAASERVSMTFQASLATWVLLPFLVRE